MQFDDDRVDTSRVNDRRDGRSAGPGRRGGSSANTAAVAGVLAMLMRGRGGKGTVMMLVVGGGILVMMTLFSGGGAIAPQAAVPAGAAEDLSTRCNQSGAISAYPDCLLVKAFNETDEVWQAEFARLGQDYFAPSLTFFDSSVQTACGPATTAVGPFYCPGDQTIYFDLGFANQLEQLGVEGDYANVYIMAHEFGHHLQNITGIESEVRRLQSEDRAKANSYGVKMELQADCFAGAWGRMADDRGNVTITRTELTQAQDAAEAVGDDRIQEQAGIRVNPESWTHGSAQQRREWYLTGFNSGDINRCNTFAQR